jgi:hypothetical protein
MNLVDIQNQSINEWFHSITESLNATSQFILQRIIDCSFKLIDPTFSAITSSCSCSFPVVLVLGPSLTLNAYFQSSTPHEEVEEVTALVVVRVLSFVLSFLVLLIS